MCTYWFSSGTCSTFKIRLYEEYCLVGWLAGCLLFFSSLAIDSVSSWKTVHWLFMSTNIILKNLSVVEYLHLNLIPVALQTCFPCQLHTVFLVINWEQEHWHCSSQTWKTENTSVTYWISFEGLFVLYTFPPVSFSTFIMINLYFQRKFYNFLLET